MTQPVLMEVLAGARDDRREADLRRLLLTFELLSFDAVADFDGDVRIYRRCRAAGVTPRGMVDCMIAAVAWRRSATLLAHDADMDRVRHRDQDRRRIAACVAPPASQAGRRHARGRCLSRPTPEKR
jgi:predicted nucleic acid-binding protein